MCLFENTVALSFQRPHDSETGLACSGRDALLINNFKIPSFLKYSELIFSSDIFN